LWRILSGRRNVWFHNELFTGKWSYFGLNIDGLYKTYTTANVITGNLYAFGNENCSLHLRYEMCVL
jgi:hypothetical protein